METAPGPVGGGQTLDLPGGAADPVFVVGLDQKGNVQVGRAGVAAIAAAGAGNSQVLEKNLSSLGEGLPFLLSERPGLGEGGGVFPHLFQGGHSAEHRLHPGQLHQKPETPGGDGPVGGGLLQNVPGFLVERGQLPAFQRFHHPDGDMVPCENVVLAFAVQQRPVQIVELDQGHIKAIVPVEELFQSFRRAVRRKTDVADLSGFLLPEKKAQIVLLRVGVVPDIVFIQAMQQIKIKIIGFQSAKLLFKYAGDVLFGGGIEFGGQEEAIPGMMGECFPQSTLRIPLLIGIGSVKIIDPLGDGFVHDSPGLHGVDVVGLSR